MFKDMQVHFFYFKCYMPHFSTSSAICLKPLNCAAISSWIMVSSGRFVAPSPLVFNNGERIYNSIILKINFFSNSTDWVSQMYKTDDSDWWTWSQSLSQLSADTSTIYMFYLTTQTSNSYSSNPVYLALISSSTGGCISNKYFPKFRAYWLYNLVINGDYLLWSFSGEYFAAPRYYVIMMNLLSFEFTIKRTIWVGIKSIRVEYSTNR